MSALAKTSTANAPATPPRTSPPSTCSNRTKPANAESTENASRPVGTMTTYFISSEIKMRLPWLGYILSLVGNQEGKIGSYLLPGLMPDTSILPGTSCKRRVPTQMLQIQNTGSFHQNGARPPTAPRRT